MKTKLYWFDNLNIDAKLGISSRPRGNDWLEDEIKHFKNSGVNILVSALTSSEIYELELDNEKEYCEKYGIRYLSYPIRDRDVPDSQKLFYEFTQQLSLELLQSKNIIIHCRQGIGRSSLLAAGVYRHIKEQNASDIFKEITLYRTSQVPDTKEQISWLDKWMELYFNKKSIVDLFSE